MTYHPTIEVFARMLRRRLRRPWHVPLSVRLWGPYVDERRRNGSCRYVAGEGILGWFTWRRPGRASGCCSLIYTVRLIPKLRRRRARRARRRT